MSQLSRATVSPRVWQLEIQSPIPLHYSHLAASFQDNLGKPVLESQTILDFAAARDDDGPPGHAESLALSSYSLAY